MDIRELSHHEIETLIEVLELARDRERRVRVTWQGGLLIKVGEGTWSPSLGTPEGV